MRILFIVGCGHSGTSLMLSIFANAAGVFAFRDETMALAKSSMKEFKDQINAFSIKDDLVVEKTPRHVHQLEKICSDTDSHALVMVRNPVDVIASFKKRGMTIRSAIDRYTADNNAWLEYENSKRLIIIKYEDLVLNTSVVLSKLSNLFEVDLNIANKARLFDKTLYFSSVGAVKSEKTDGLGEANHLALRNYQIRQPIVNMNGQWKDRISRDELAMIISNLQPLIQKLGYTECYDY